MTNYFSEISNTDQLKKAYYDLAKKLHPDAGGTKEEFQEMVNEYEHVLKRLLNGEGFNQEDQTDEVKLDEILRNAYHAIMNLPAINIELAGKWIWVTGATYPVREKLREAGYFFASKKKAWYFKGAESGGRGNYSLDEIRSKYDAKKLQNKIELIRN